MLEEQIKVESQFKEASDKLLLDLRKDWKVVSRMNLIAEEIASLKVNNVALKSQAIVINIDQGRLKVTPWEKVSLNNILSCIKDYLHLEVEGYKQGEDFIIVQKAIYNQNEILHRKLTTLTERYNRTFRSLRQKVKKNVRKQVNEGDLTLNEEKSIIKLFDQEAKHFHDVISLMKNELKQPLR